MCKRVPTSLSLSMRRNSIEPRFLLEFPQCQTSMQCSLNSVKNAPVSTGR